MATKFKTAIVLLISLFAFTNQSCKKDKLAINNRTFSVSLFKQNMITQLGNSIRGYSFVIGQNGSYADGSDFGIRSINPSGGTNPPMSQNTYINIASVTKTLTAIAAIRLLDSKDIPLNTAIDDYLPAYWNVAPSIKTITFEELLSHTSGLRQSTTSYDSLKATCLRGLEGSKTRSYANINFALFRVLLPYIDDNSGLKSQENAAVGSNTIPAFEASMSQRYLSLMQENVFTPAGISNATCDNALVSGSLSDVFSEGASLNIVNNTGDWTEISGGGGYYLTTFQMAQIMAFLVHSTNLLSTGQKSAMNQDLLGWDPEDSPMTSAGQAYGKDGALRWGASGNSTTAGLQTYVCRYPNGVEIAISVNSLNGGNFRSLGGLALAAYEASWED